LNFLDISIIKATDKISFDIYRKETTSDIIIPNDSCHPTEHTLAAIRYFTNTINTYNLDHTEKQTETSVVKQFVNNNKFNISILNRINGKKQKEKKTAKKEDGPNLLIAGKKQDWSRSCSKTQM
jgi:hypothetical protein